MPSQGFLQGLDAERGLQANRHPPRENPPAEPIDYGGQVDEAARQGHVSDVHGPDLVGAVDAHAPEQIRVDLVPRRWLRGVRLTVERLEAHPLHEGRNVTATDLDPLLV